MSLLEVFPICYFKNGSPKELDLEEQTQAFFGVTDLKTNMAGWKITIETIGDTSSSGCFFSIVMLVFGEVTTKKKTFGYKCKRCCYWALVMLEATGTFLVCGLWNSGPESSQQ